MFQLDISADVKLLGVLCFCVSGLLFFLAFFRLFSFSDGYGWVRNQVFRVLEKTEKMQEKQIQSYRKMLKEYGVQEKIPLICRWDRAFVQSGVQEKIHFLNSRICAGIMLTVAAAGAAFFMLLLPAGVWAGLIWMIVEPGAVCFLIRLLCIRRMNRTESELLSFLNIVDNFSVAEQDLFRILGNAGEYLKEPLGSALKECSIRAAQTGNRFEAVQELICRIGHPKFQEMMQNLEICSRNEANYSEVLADLRESMTAYLSARREENSILREGKIQIMLIVLMGIPMIMMLTAITGVPVFSMADSPVGWAAAGYWVVLLIVIFYQMCFADNRKAYL